MWQFDFPGRLVFGRRSVERLPEVLATLAAGTALLVTDRAIRASGVPDVVRRAAGAAAEIHVFDGGVPEPSFDIVRACAERARASGANVLIAVGGGSVMDLGKAAAVLLAHGGRIADYVGEGRVPGPILPLVCLPTTAGTGSEVSPACVLTDPSKGGKVGLLSPHLRPRAAIVDSDLSRSCPPRVTADSGIDALTHALEAFLARDHGDVGFAADERPVFQGRQPIGRALAAEAITLVGRNLRRAVTDGEDAEAREAVALGATVAGLAFSSVGVGLVHALEYPLGGTTLCSHGAMNGLLLPHVLRFQRPVRQDELGTVARLLGEEVEALPVAEAAERGIAAVERLCRDVGMPQDLESVGIAVTRLAVIAEQAAGYQRLIRLSARTPRVGDLEAILRAAFRS